MLRFSAFNMRTTPELIGTISWVAADQTEDKRTGASYYEARVAVPEAQIARLKDLKIIPGMPVEAFIQTGSRTALSYLLKPLKDQVMRSFRES
jgi:HlyD family secretion protein